MKIAYVTAESCGLGHAVRGMALVQAGRRVGITLRAFGPPKDVPEYEGSDDWREQVAQYEPDLILGDVGWHKLVGLLPDVPKWLLARWVDRDWAARCTWARRIAIEPLAERMLGITAAISPIVVEAPRFMPADGQRLRAGYNAWWEATWFGYRDRVRWCTEGSPERQARIDVGGEMTANGADVLMAMLA